jgi:hypothetical protein
MMMAVIFSNVLCFFISLILWIKRAKQEEKLNQVLGGKNVENIKTAL